MTIASPSRSPMARVLSLRDFRLLFAGTTTSLLGDSFAFIATPWLVLQLTHDPLALGIVLALQGVPRAVFILVGGAITDRMSPRVIMLISDLVRTALTVLMAAVVFSGTVQMWMLYGFGLAFGLVSGFAIPAENSIVPMLVAQDDLQAGNSLMMGVGQLVGFIGPTVAGIVIGGYAGALFGIGLAFAIDALSFAVSAACLWLLRGAHRHGTTQAQGILESVIGGIRYLWDEPALRLMLFVILGLNFFIVGPLLVGVPVLADQRLPEGAVAFGLLMSGYSGGNLGGYLLAGALPRPGSLALRVLMIALLAAFGLVIGALGFVRLTGLDFAMMLLLGLGNGYLSIILITWMQTRTPREMLGRMMSIFMLSNFGLIPVSQAVSGAIIKWNLELLFVAAAALDLAMTAWMAFQPALKEFSESLVAGAPSGGTAPAAGDKPVQ